MKKICSLVLIIILSLKMLIVFSAGEEVLFDINAINNTNNLEIEDVTYDGKQLAVSGQYGRFAGVSVVLSAVEENNRMCALAEGKTIYKGKFKITFGVAKEQVGKEIFILVKGANESDTASVSGKLLTIGAVDVNEFAEYAATIENLLNLCKEKGISADYETVNYHVIKKSIEVLDFDASTQNTERYTYNARAVRKLYAETKTTLEGYIDGVKKPYDVPQYITGEQTIDGRNFISDTMTDGEITKSPMYYLGYVYWGAPVEELYELSDVGVNLVHLDIGTSQIIVKPSDIAAWNTAANDPYGKLEYSVMQNTDIKKEGVGSAKLTAAGEGDVVLKQSVKVEPNAAYDFGVHAMSPNADEFWLEVGGKPLGQNKRYYFKSNSNWSEIKYSYMTLSGESEITYAIGVSNKADAIYFDNAYLQKNGSKKNMLLNPGFEETQPIAEDYVINYDNIQRFKSLLDTAEKNNISVVIMASVHYVPKFIYALDSSINNGGESYYGAFVPYNPTHPIIKQVLSDFYEALIPEIKDYKCINSICVSNEPRFNSMVNDDYYQEYFRDMLRNKYTDISVFNEKMGMAYQGFDEVVIPANANNLALYNEWRGFNDSILTAYHKFMRDKVKELAPNLQVCIKAMQYIMPKNDENGRTSGGGNYEQVAEYMDINGNDGWAYMGNDSRELQAKLAWYDYLMSVKEIPVLNAEDHVIADAAGTIYREGELTYNIADIWQGVMHGRAGSALWLWFPTEIKYSKGAFYENAVLNARADYMAEIGKTALDFRRLAREIAAVNNEKARVGIIYSDYSLLSDSHYASGMYNAYKEVTYNGERVRFITETDPRQMLDENLQVLVIPCCGYMKEGTISLIKEFSKEGKHVILLECGCGYHDENGGALSDEANAVLAGIDTRAKYSHEGQNEVGDSSGAVKKLIADTLSRLERTIKMCTNGASVEWSAVEYGGDYLINLCNYGTEAVQVTIEENSGKVGEAIDLISGETVNRAFTAEPYVPMLIKVSYNEPGTTFYCADEFGMYVPTKSLTGREVIVKAGTNKAEPGAEVYNYVTVYNKGCLYMVMKHCAVADQNGFVAFSSNISIDKALDLNECEVKSFLWSGDLKMVPLENSFVLNNSGK